MKRDPDSSGKRALGFYRSIRGDGLAGEHRMNDMNPLEAERQHDEANEQAKARDEILERLDGDDVLEFVVSELLKSDSQTWAQAYKDQDSYLALRVLNDLLFRGAESLADEERL